MNEITEEDIKLLEMIKDFNMAKDNALKHCILNIKLAKAVKELQEEKK